MAEMKKVTSSAKVLEEAWDVAEHSGIQVNDYLEMDDIVEGGTKWIVDTLQSYLEKGIIPTIEDRRPSDETIRSIPWVEPQPLNNDFEELSEDEKETDEPEEVVEEPKKRRYVNRLSHDEVRQISEFIRDKCDGKKIVPALNACVKKFKYTKKKNIERVLIKETYVDISNEYFTLDDSNKIRKVSVIIPDTLSNTGYTGISNMIHDKNGDVIACITDDMSANDIVKLAMVRWKDYKDNIYDTLGGGVKEIFIMEADSNNKRGNNSEIKKAIKEKYDVDVDTALVSAVRNGRAYKEICSRFER